jgi:hypothetical protein
MFYSLLLTLPLLTSCGKNQGSNSIVSNVSLGSYESEGEKHLEVLTEIDLGSITLPNISYPIIKAKDGRTVGALEIRSLLDGNNELAFDLNLASALGGALTQNSLLPNGNKIPVGGLQNSQVYAYELKNSRSTVYLAYSGGVTMLGLAINIDQLDKLGGNIGSVNFFPSFNKNGIEGLAGIYTSQTPGKSGLAFFVSLKTLALTNSEIVVAESLQRSGITKNSSTLVFIDQEPQSKTKSKILREMQALDKKRTRLKIR